jgi:ABC-type microcin C transport system permease subunit YejE
VLGDFVARVDEELKMPVYGITALVILILLYFLLKLV